MFCIKINIYVFKGYKSCIIDLLKRQRDETPICWFILQNAHWVWTWDRPMLGAQNSFQVSHACAGAQALGPSPAAYQAPKAHPGAL